MKRIAAASIVFLLALAYAISGFAPATHAQQDDQSSRGDDPKAREGQAIFRYDTFGDEQLWTNVLRMQEAVAGVDPATALAVGLKVDVDALPPAIVTALREGAVDLRYPAVTTELLRLNAVVGLKG